MKNKKKLLTLALPLLMFSMVLSSCSGTKTPSSQNTSSEEVTSEKVSSEEATSKDTSVEESSEKISSEESTETPSTSEEISSEESTETPSTSEEISSEESTETPITSEEISSDSATSEESSELPIGNSYVIEINGVASNLTLNPNASEENLLAEYMIQGVTVSEGDILTFKHNGLAVENIGPSQGDNNVISVGGSLKIQTAGSVDVYFKVYNDGGHSVWVSGYQAPELTHDWYLVGSFNGWKENDLFGLVQNNEQPVVVQLLGINLKSGDQLKIKQIDDGNDQTNEWYGYDTLVDDFKVLFDTTSDGNIVIKQDGLYNVMWHTELKQVAVFLEEDDPTPGPSTNTSSPEDPSSEPSSSVTVVNEMVVEIAGVAQNMKENIEQSDENVLVEYMLRQVEVNAGDVLEFKLNGELISNVIADQTSNAILDKGLLKIQTAGTVDIYFKHKVDGTYSVWVSGYQAPELTHDWYLVGSINGWTEVESYGFIPNEGNANEVQLLGVNLESGSQIKIKDKATWDTAVGFNNVKEECRNLVTEGDGGNIVINETGIYDFYWDFNSNKLWIAKVTEEVENPSSNPSSEIVSSEEPTTSEDPVTSEDPITSETPSEEPSSEDPVTSETPVTSEPSSEEPSSEEPVTSETPVTNSYVIEINGEPYDLVVNEEATLYENQIGEYMLLQVDVEEGDVVVVKIDGEILGAYGIDDGANLVNNEGTVTIRQTGTVDVYFKVWADGGYSIYVTGYEAPVEENEYYLVGSMSDWGKVDSYIFVPHSENDYEVVLENVSLTAGDEIKITNGDDIWVGFTNVKALCIGAANVEKSPIPEGKEFSDDNILIKDTGVYSFYYDFKTGDEAKLWIIKVSGEEPEVPEDVIYTTINIHYYNYKEWANVNIYSWTAPSGEVAGKWPGTAMTAETDGWYTISLQVDETKVDNLMIIFNDGSAKTADIECNSEADQYYFGFNTEAYDSKEAVSEKIAELEQEPVQARYLYLKPNSNWTESNARFAAYFFGAGDFWVSMTDEDGDGIYECEIPEGGYTSVIFCRMNPGTTANNWNNKWNQTADLTISEASNLYTVKDGTWDKGGGTWSSK